MPETLSALEPSQLAQYAADGFLVVRQVFSRERVTELEVAAQQVRARSDLIDTDNIRCRWQDDLGGVCRFDCFDPVIDLSDVCARAARDPQLLAIVSSLYGEQACLFKDKLIFKAPGTLGYKLHQDYIGWESFPKTFLTAIVAIDAADRESGATEVFPGYHRHGSLTPSDGMYHQLPESAVDLSAGVSLDLAPGDVAFFSGFTPHRSGPNTSDRWRRLLYLSYNAMSDGGEQRERHYAEFRGWLQDRYAEYGRTSTFFR